MRRIFFIVLVLPLLVHAQEKCSVVLDEAMNRIQTEMPVRMEFAYYLYNNIGELQFEDAGELLISDNGRYIYSLSPMKIWCNGETQWNYMAQTNELYITSPDSEESRNFSPLYLMQLYKKGYTGSLKSSKDEYVITLVATDDSDISRVELTMDREKMYIKLAELYTIEGRISVVVNKYERNVATTEKQFSCPLNEYPDVEIINMMN